MYEVIIKKGITSKNGFRYIYNYIVYYELAIAAKLIRRLKETKDNIPKGDHNES